MAQITLYAQANGNWDAINNWNTVAGGGGTAYTNPQNNITNTFICDLNSKAITFNVSTITVDKIIASDSVSYLTNASGSKILNAILEYSGNMTTTGFIRNSGTLTINGKVLSTGGTGYTVGTSSSTEIIINAGSDGIAVESTSKTTNRTININSGSFTINGNVARYGSGSGYAVYSTRPFTFNGNIIMTGSTYAVYQTSSAMTWTPNLNETYQINVTVGSYPLILAGGSLTLNGYVNCRPTNVSSTQKFYISASSCPFTWLDTLVVPENVTMMLMTAGPLVFADATKALNIQNYGKIWIWKSGTQAETITAAGGTAQIRNMSKYAQVCLMNMQNKATEDIVTRHTMTRFLGARKV